MKEIYKIDEDVKYLETGGASRPLADILCDIEKDMEEKNRKIARDK